MGGENQWLWFWAVFLVAKLLYNLICPSNRPPVHPYVWNILGEIFFKFSWINYFYILSSFIKICLWIAMLDRFLDFMILKVSWFPYFIKFIVCSVVKFSPISLYKFLASLLQNSNDILSISVSSRLQIAAGGKS